MRPEKSAQPITGASYPVPSRVAQKTSVRDTPVTPAERLPIGKQKAGPTRCAVTARVFPPSHSLRLQPGSSPETSPGKTEAFRPNHFGELLIAILDRLACGIVIADERRKISFISCNARKILNLGERAGGFGMDGCCAVQSLLDRTRTRLTPGLLLWVAVSRKWAITQVIDEASNAMADNASAIILVDLDSCAQPSLATLQQIFGLTSAEGSLAIAMVQGIAPDEIAERRSVSRTTIRTQLASVFAKTQTRRQAELVARLGRLGVLP